MKVIIAGAGIGGLTTALSLHAAGIEAEVYEATPELRPLGVGINVLPHAVRELTELGLAEALAAHGVETEALMYANRFGQTIWREARGKFAGYRWPQYSIHRGTLQRLLSDAVVERLGGQSTIRLGKRVVSAEARGETVVAQFADGTSATGDVLVAADGIHSAIRAQAYPEEGPPIWNRRILWRGVTLAPPFLGGATMIMAGHQDQKFVCYPIDPVLTEGGEALINWIAELRFGDEARFRREDWNRAWIAELRFGDEARFRREDWNREGKLEEFLPPFEDWHFGWLDVPTLIRGADQVFEYPMVDRDPVDQWTFGRVTLLGDAAHAMYPIGSNGASQAILDARTLAFELAAGGSIDEALTRYEAARRPATSRLVLLNRQNGPEQVMQMAHERAPQGFADVHGVLSQAELEATAGEYKRIAGFDRDALNERPSLDPQKAAP